MILNVVLYPDPVLQKPTEKVGEIDGEVRELAQNMIETMYSQKGIGLAAPQVGISKRICVIDISEDRDEPLVLINPQITSREGSQVSEEGCLSFPRVYGKVERSEKVDVTYTNLEGKKCTITGAEELFSVVLQHEIDHLDGILFINLMTPTERLKIKKSLKKMKEDYKKLKA